MSCLTRGGLLDDDTLNVMQENDIPMRFSNPKASITTGPVAETPEFRLLDNMASSDTEEPNQARASSPIPASKKETTSNTEPDSEVEDLDAHTQKPEQKQKHKSRHHTMPVQPAHKQAEEDDEEAEEGEEEEDDTSPADRHRSTSFTLNDHDVARKVAELSMHKRAAEVSDSEPPAKRVQTAVIKSETHVQEEDVASSLEDIPEAPQQSSAATNDDVENTLNNFDKPTQEEHAQGDTDMDEPGEEDQEVAKDTTETVEATTVKLKAPKPTQQQKNKKRERGSKTPSTREKAADDQNDQKREPSSRTGATSSMLKKIQENINNPASKKILISSSDILDQPQAHGLFDWLSLQGLTRIEDVPARRTDFVCIVGEHVKRTAKVLRSLAQGKLVVTEKWITASRKQGHMLDPRDFIHPDVAHSIDVHRSELFNDQVLFFTTALKNQYGKGWTSIQSLARELGAKAVEFGSAKKGDELGKHEDVIFFGKDKNDSEVDKLINDHGREVFCKDMLTLGVLEGGVDLTDKDMKLTASKKSRVPKKTLKTKRA